MLLKYLFVIAFYSKLSVESAKILGIFDFPSKSHHILGSTLLKALAERGHEVTMLSPFPLKKPVKNYEDIDLEGLLQFKDEFLISEMVKSLDDDTSAFAKMQKMGNTMKVIGTINEMALNQTLEKLLKPNRKFDLIIQNWFFNTAYLGIANYFQAPVIAFSGSGSTVVTNRITGNTHPYSYVPNMFLGFPSEMNFMQRVLNTIINFFFTISLLFTFDPVQEQLYQKYFPNGPPLEELEKNISLVLINSHFSTESPRPYVPSLIQIGGFHVEESRKLTGELKAYMDSAKEGVLYFSLGSNVKSADLPKKKLEAITKTFAKLPLKVLWKFESDDVPNLSSNVKIGKWLPQRDILAHPNLKLFVTHGGLLSTTEAIYHGVPVVGIPLFADQSYNIANCAHKGFAIPVSYPDLSEESLTKAINEVLSDLRYGENAKQLSRIMKDQPIKPMDSAVFWVEYVLRHKGAHHLKTSALRLTWYQYFLLDVMALLVGVIFVISFVSYFVISKLWKALKSLRSNKSKEGKKSGKKSKLA